MDPRRSWPKSTLVAELPERLREGGHRRAPSGLGLADLATVSSHLCIRVAPDAELSAPWSSRWSSSRPEGFRQDPDQADAPPNVSRQDPTITDRFDGKHLARNRKGPGLKPARLPGRGAAQPSIGRTTALEEGIRVDAAPTGRQVPARSTSAPPRATRTRSPSAPPTRTRSPSGWARPAPPTSPARRRGAGRPTCAHG